jgi:hypothetical protein
MLETFKPFIGKNSDKKLLSWKKDQDTDYDDDDDD